MKRSFPNKDTYTIYQNFQVCYQFLSGGHSDTEPPESIPNSVVKRVSGDGSVGLPHVRVAHRQAPIEKQRTQRKLGFLFLSVC